MPIIRKLLQESLGDNCCDDTILKRYTPEGVLESSRDGGETWQPAPYLDPRIISPVFPGVEGMDKCTYAGLFVAWLMDEVIEPSAEILSTGATIALIIGIIGAALILLLLTGGLAGLAIPVAIELASYLLTLTSTELTDSFNETTQHEIQCLFFCHIADDGTLSETQFSELVADINNFVTDPSAQIALKLILVIAGNVGATNAMHSKALAEPTAAFPPGYCDDCECTACDNEAWQLLDGSHGTNISWGEDENGKYVQADSTAVGGAQFVILTTHPGTGLDTVWNDPVCSHVLQTITPPEVDLLVSVVPQNGSYNGNLQTLIGNGCFWLIQAQSDGTSFTFRQYLGDC